MLQSSFIFYILAHKFGRLSDDQIRETCYLSLRALDVFIETVNMKYQRIFARVLRRVMQEVENGDLTPEIRPLDPEILKFRWIPGFHGLWDHEMGRPAEARKRVFPHD
jgi:hypothetical protein